MTSPSGPRVGIIGNMNNGGFAIMRYFRDLGVDAHLFPFATDGAGNLSHFAPDADTWDIDRWSPFIHVLPVPNTAAALTARELKARDTTRTMLANCAHLVGSGIAPALAQLLGRRLDVFFPYGMGIEFYGDLELLSLMERSPLHRWRYRRMRRLQAEGIKAARYRFNVEMSHTSASFSKLGVSAEPLAIPAVYNGPDAPPPELSPALLDAKAHIEAADLAVFACSRLLWVRDPRLTDDRWVSFTKNSDWMIRGLARFHAANPGCRVVLTVVEYGPDVEATRALARELGVDHLVHWMPKMPRREIMTVLSWADAGVGEFYVDDGVIWGGTGWEVLASGKPFLQSFNFTPTQFERDFGHRPPPILDVKSEKDFGDHLQMLAAASDRGRSIGEKSRQWFDAHNGRALAGLWLDRVLGDDHDRR